MKGNETMTKTNTTPRWKIAGLNRTSGKWTFGSFDLFPSNRRAGIYCSALLRGGLIEVAGSDAWGNNTYKLTLKGSKFIKDHNETAGS